MSAKLVRETDHGLALVSRAEPSWWANEDLMHGFPSPAQVRSWWEEEHSPPEEPGVDNRRNVENRRNTRNRVPYDEVRIADSYAQNSYRDARNRSESPSELAGNRRNRDSRTITEDGIAEKGLNAPKTDGNGEDIPGITVIPGSTGNQDELPLGALGDWEEI